MNYLKSISRTLEDFLKCSFSLIKSTRVYTGGGGGEGAALGYFWGGYVPPGTPNWHPILEEISPKIDTLF